MNVNDYLKWRGDLSFAQDPFNEVDNVAICIAFYTDFDSLIKEKEKISIKELADLFSKNHTKKEIDSKISFIQKAPYALFDLAKSNRFKDAVMHDFVSILDEETTEQFACAQIDIDKNTTLVVFRGTDDTLIGWKEDFKIAYEVTKAQISAVDYVSKRLKKAKKYIFMGHSKGGNLAIYSALKAPSHIKRKIQTVYSNDGPGLNIDFIDSKEMDEMADRYIKIIPKFDVIGTIFDNDKANTVVVDAVGFSIAQHAGESWQVMSNRFVRAKQENSSLKLKEGFNHFMKSVTMEERKVFVEELFDALNELGIKRISEINKMSLVALIRALKKVSEMDNQAKETAEQLTKIFTNMVAEDAEYKREQFKESVMDTQEKIGEEARKTGKIIGKKMKKAKSGLEEIIQRRKDSQE